MAAAVRAWELLATDDMGPGDEPDSRQYRVSAVAECGDGRLRVVTAQVDMTPEQLQVWLARVGGQRVRP